MRKLQSASVKKERTLTIQIMQYSTFQYTYIEREREDDTFEVENRIGVGDDGGEMSAEIGVDEDRVVTRRRWRIVGIGLAIGLRHERERERERDQLWLVVGVFLSAAMARRAA